MNDLQVFRFENQQVRIIDRNGEEWWVAKDICNILSLYNVSKAVSSLDDDEKNYIDSNITNGDIGNVKSIENIPEMRHGGKSLLIINEAGLFRLIFQSRKPIAKRLKKWVFTEVLPIIRKTGTYTDTNNYLHSKKKKETNHGKFFNQIKELYEDVIIKSDEEIEKLREQIERLREQNKNYREIYSNMKSVDIWYSMINVAKIINIAGVGRNKIFAILKQLKICYVDNGCNVPYPDYIDDGYFKVVDKQSGHNISYKVMLVSFNGILFIKRKIESFLKQCQLEAV
jgi:prophage antirepressor-like protein